MSLSEPVWGKYSSPILCRVEDLVGTGHHSIFTDKEGKMRIVFHAHNSTTQVHDRLMYIGTMEFTGREGRRVLRMTDDPIIRPITPEDVTDRIGGISVGETTKEYFSLSGMKLSEPQKGVNIVRENGKTRKVIVE